LSEVVRIRSESFSLSTVLPRGTNWSRPFPIRMMRVPAKAEVHDLPVDDRRIVRDYQFKQFAA